jgi:CheY-like chemotaxis protein
MKRNILFVDDEGWFAKPYVKELEIDFDVHFCEEVANGNLILQNRPEIKLLILDVMMPTPAGVPTSATENDQSTGIWFLRQIQSIVISRPLPVVILTNRGKSVVIEAVATLKFPENLVTVGTKTEYFPTRLRQAVKERMDLWHP